MGDLAAMGYPVTWRAKVLRSAMTGYNRTLKKVQQGQTTRNRKGQATLANRRFKKLLGEKEWYRVEDEEETETMPPWEQRGHWLKPKFRKGRNNRRVEGIMFIPYTPESTLKTALTRAEANLNYTTRIQLVRADPDPELIAKDAKMRM